MRINLDQSIQLLKKGEVIAVPTETVYGLAACLDQPAAIEKIFEFKNRPKTNPLIIHIAERDNLDLFCTEYPPHFDALVEKFWPGPITYVLRVNNKTEIPAAVTSGLSTAGFRIPHLELTRQLISKTGPLVMPSANLSGKPSATRPEHVEEDFGLQFPVLDGGICTKGLESTILMHLSQADDKSNKGDEWVILRLGALPPEAFVDILGYVPRLMQKEEGERPLCPGQLFRHYAPRARLILGEPDTQADTQFILGFKERSYPRDKRVMILGSLDNPHEVAEKLYDVLRQLDVEGAAEAWVDTDFPRFGLWQTIAERLYRASVC